MRITNSLFVNADGLAGTYQPHIVWGYSGGAYTPSDFATNSDLIGLPVGSLLVYTRSSAATYAIVETWQKTNAKGLASDWQCIAGRLTAYISVADFTDGGSTAGTLVLTPQLPAGAFVMGSSVRDITGFAGDTSAALTLGDGSDADRYNTSTYNVFTTAAMPASMTTQFAPSGNRAHSAAQAITVTVTTGADFTSCKSNGAGRAVVTIDYLI